jgi:hypothetical protein
MLNEICAYLNNWFDMNDDHEPLPSWRGQFVISDGNIDLEGKILNGQYFRIQNSIFNDGVHKYPAEEGDLQDETFKGKIQAIAVPKDLIAIAGEIAEWMNKNGGVESTAMSPYNSESFAGYSYSKSNGVGASSKESLSTPMWAAVYGGRLARWRKI